MPGKKNPIPSADPARPRNNFRGEKRSNEAGPMQKTTAASRRGKTPSSQGGAPPFSPDAGTVDASGRPSRGSIGSSGSAAPLQRTPLPPNLSSNSTSGATQSRRAGYGGKHPSIRVPSQPTKRRAGARPPPPTPLPIDTKLRIEQETRPLSKVTPSQYKKRVNQLEHNDKLGDLPPQDMLQSRKGNRGGARQNGSSRTLVKRKPKLNEATLSEAGSGSGGTPIFPVPAALESIPIGTASASAFDAAVSIPIPVPKDIPASPSFALTRPSGKPLFLPDLEHEISFSQSSNLSADLLSAPYISTASSLPAVAPEPDSQSEYNCGSSVLRTTVKAEFDSSLDSGSGAGAEGNAALGIDAESLKSAGSARGGENVDESTRPPSPPALSEPVIRTSVTSDDTSSGSGSPSPSAISSSLDLSVTSNTSDLPRTPRRKSCNIRILPDFTRSPEKEPKRGRHPPPSDRDDDDDDDLPPSPTRASRK
ncbi:hypothetical protein D9757_012587 [Collybiopsis confluens]|uniref:Uncharacterized protein n=1 Tax=Collybiopsis confluens TaxID=2823264 RepID=A0A8H5FVX4_9AGAR|nr:hypothetical protein D9757_012587 [Collybiopsis confluens]